ncbi:hypothetical protein MCC93_18120 [Morococcus cerebrosus]|uniref:Uncharacterized protein n=1 Tax=Morococcus cerebrosus TaxID=1056807 RepID=A0A0C1ED98_9NEIS|nr:hypothetical protein MCC93_18120 [Morococcus cerebrosus]KJJ12538.1 hypothetical protein HMPREF3156_02486 [Neisseria sp. HMSC06F02]
MEKIKTGRLKTDFGFSDDLFASLTHLLLPHNTFSYRYAFYTSFS